MELEDLREQLETLLASKPETGAQWAEICRLEQEIASAEQDAAELAYERQCADFHDGGSQAWPDAERQRMIEARRLK